MKKFLIIILGIIIVGIISIVFFMQDKEFNEEKVFENVEPINNSMLYIPVSKKGKYGFIDKNGKILIDYKFDNASPFYKIKVNDREYEVSIVEIDKTMKIILKNEQVIYSQKIKENTYLNDNFSEFCANILQKNENAWLGGRISFMEDCGLIPINSYDGQEGKLYDYNDKYNIEVVEIEPIKFNAYKDDVSEYSSYSYDEYLEDAKMEIEQYEYYLVNKKDKNDKTMLDCERLIIENNVLYICSNNYIPFISKMLGETGYFTEIGEKITIKTQDYRLLNCFRDLILLEEIEYDNYENYSKEPLSKEEFIKNIEEYDDNIYGEEENDDEYKTLLIKNDGTKPLKDNEELLYLLEDGYVIKNSNDEYYICDENFKKINQKKYDLILPYMITDGLLIYGELKNNEYIYGILDTKGEKMLEAQFDSIYATQNNIEENYFAYECVIYDRSYPRPDYNYNEYSDKINIYKEIKESSQIIDGTEVFNMNIEPYLGEGKSGSQTKSAIEQILNINDEDRKVAITLDGEEIEDSLKIFVSRKYSITSKKDSDGYINKVVIETE